MSYLQILTPRSREILDYKLEVLEGLTTITAQQINKLKEYLTKELPRIKFIHKGDNILISNYGYVGAIIHKETLEILSLTDKAKAKRIKII